jgi:hypothetical protein
MDAEAEPVPPKLTTVAYFVSQLKDAVVDVKLLVSRKPEASAVVFALGILVGVVFAMLIFGCCLDRPPPAAARSGRRVARNGRVVNVDDKGHVKATAAVPADEKWKKAAAKDDDIAAPPAEAKKDK